MADQYNPIQSVGSVTNVPCPSSYQWNESDVSDSNAGRTEDAKMHKMMIATKVHLELAWQNIPTSDASTILNAFTQSEYFNVKYLDPKANGFVTKKFYVGDRSSPAYNTRLGLWSNVSFNIIEQ